MKINLVGRDSGKIDNLKNILGKYNFEYTDDNPELVFCYGGDGMFLIAERKFPGVPKILVKGSPICNTGQKLDCATAIELYLNKNYTIQEIKKLKAMYVGAFETRKLVGVNDIVLRNTLPTEALRFRVAVNGKWFDKTFIGDGVVIATPYGSTKGAYFYSVTRKEFSDGIGLAFNNSTEYFEPIFVNSDGKIEIEIVRGLGVLVADNNRDFINLEKGDKVVIEQSQDLARRILLKS